MIEGKNISSEFFEALDDNQLAIIAKDNEVAMLLIITRMMSLIIYRANFYSKKTISDKDDLIQEGLIGLVSAVHSFSLKGGASFRTYAGVCIENHISSYLKSLYRQKNLPITNYVSLSNGNESILNSNGFLTISDSNPEEQVIIREELSSVWELVKSSLTDFELHVFKLYLGGISYKNISAKMETSIKSVDNALQRIRRKLQKMLAEKDFSNFTDN